MLFVGECLTRNKKSVTTATVAVEAWLPTVIELACDAGIIFAMGIRRVF